MARSKRITCQDDGYRYLTGKILEQSKRDLKGSDPVQALDAFCWWVFGDAWLFCDALGFYLSPYGILRWLVGGFEHEKEQE